MSISFGPIMLKLIKPRQGGFFMAIDKPTQYGAINISLDAIAAVAGNAAVQCYGVIGVTNKKTFSGNVDLNKTDFSKDVIVRKNKTNTFEIDLYIVVAYGVRITEVVSEVQKKVKYDLEMKFHLKFKAINVYVQGIKNI